MYTVRFASQFEASLFEKTLQERQIQYQRNGPVTIEFPDTVSPRTVDWLEDISRIHAIGKRG